MADTFKFLFLAVFLQLVSGSHVFSQGEPESGTSVISPTANEIMPFVYDPSDEEFWRKVTELTRENSFERLVDISASRIKDLGENTEEGGESKLALAKGLLGAGFSYGATVILKDLVRTRIGMDISREALSTLDQIVQTHPYDKEELDNILTNNEFGTLHPDIQSFVSFHLALINRHFGYKDWSDEEYRNIRPESYWDFKWQYLTAVGEVARDRIESAIDSFDKIIGHAKAPEDLRNQSLHQKARLLFEKREFQRAHEILKMLKGLPQREQARVILERAWAKYYLKDYSKALGLLEVLDSPYFEFGNNFEKFILKTVIFKELCHYEAVTRTAEEFRNYFAQALLDVKKRNPLEKNVKLAQQALLDQRLQDDANFVNVLISERTDLEETGWEDYGFYNALLQEYKIKEAEMRDRQQRQLTKKVRQVAEDLLDAEEQITFLDYAAKMDSLGVIRRGDMREYKSEKISYLTFDRIYWPVEKEYWLDELEDYKSLISSRCGERQLGSVPEINKSSWEAQR